MRYLALASDYDGTLAHHGAVNEQTVQALERLVHSGRKLILVTGRELADLQSVFPHFELCERVVAENGAILYNPATREKSILADRPPESFIESLRMRGVDKMSIGDVIVATWQPYEQKALDAIRETGLELQIIFNKDAVMILPSGTNKMTGLSSALRELKLSLHNVIGVGDAENDHAFLSSCECAVAVANAVPALKERADFITVSARGAGVGELIEKLIENDASDIRPRCDMDAVLVGKSQSGDVRLPGYGRNVLICGQSGSGKSTLVTALLERIIDKKYQICLVDPEGDYENLPGSRSIGDEKRPPSIEDIEQALEDPSTDLVVNLVGVPSTDRPVYFSSLIRELQRCRFQAGRPHWLVIDEAHHVLPSEWALTQTALPEELSNLVLITVHPEHVSPVALRRINTVIVVGREPRKLMEDFGKAVTAAVPSGNDADLPRGEALLWRVDERQVLRFTAEAPRTEHFRHRRKYAEGRLEDERRFRFRGPQNKMDLSIQNLNMFIQVAEGIDSETWQFHLKRGDYSKWFRNALKDLELADSIAAIERASDVPDMESRKRIKEAILEKYAAPA